MSTVRNGHEHLNAQWHNLQQRWRQTGEQWRDSVRQHFYREFWAQWEREVPATLRALDTLGPVLEQARRSVK